MSKTINFFFFQKLKFMETSRVWYQVNPLQQFLCPLQKINSCLGTSQMARVVQAAKTAVSRVDRWPPLSDAASEHSPQLRSRDAFLEFLDQSEQRFSSNRTSPDHCLAIVQFYSTHLLRL